MKYEDYPIPDDKEPEEYSYKERRAEIYKLIMEKGHPDYYSLRQLGKRYDVSHQTIKKDKDRIRDAIEEEMAKRGKKKAQELTHMIYKKGLEKHMENKDWDKAKNFVDDWNDYLFDKGFQEKAADKVEHQADNSFVELMKEVHEETSDEE